MELHWILTLQWESVSGLRTWSGHGVLYPHPGETRADVLARLRQEISDAPTGVPLNTGILFFDLAPNTLNGE